MPRTVAFSFGTFEVDGPSLAGLRRIFQALDHERLAALLDGSDGPDRTARAAAVVRRVPGAVALVLEACLYDAHGRHPAPEVVGRARPSDVDRFLAAAEQADLAAGLGNLAKKALGLVRAAQVRADRDAARN